MQTGLKESRLTDLSRIVETFSGKDIAANAPIVGRDVFTQTAGIHADGDAKGDLYHSRLEHTRFGRARRYALGKLSGKASLIELAARRPKTKMSNRELPISLLVPCKPPLTSPAAHNPIRSVRPSESMRIPPF